MTTSVDLPKRRALGKGLESYWVDLDFLLPLPLRRHPLKREGQGRYR